MIPQDEWVRRVVAEIEAHTARCATREERAFVRGMQHALAAALGHERERAGDPLDQLCEAAELTPAERQVFRLLYGQGLSQREIAAGTGLAERTVLLYAQRGSSKVRRWRAGAGGRCMVGLEAALAAAWELLRERNKT